MRHDNTNRERAQAEARQTIQIILDATRARAYGRPMETSHKPARAFPAIVVGGLITGVLDMSYAMVVYSPKAPLLIPQGIAAGLLGVDHQLGGTTGTIILGFMCHFTIALGAASVFYLVSRQWSFLTEHPVIAGAIFGACVYGFMHFVVIPLSALPQHPFHWRKQLPEFLWHLVGVGQPIAWSVRHYTR